MTKLPRVTLVAIDTLNKGAAIVALQRSLEQVQPDRCILLTDEVVEIEGIEVIKIPVIKSKDKYSRFVIKELWKYIDTDFLITIQHDGYILNGDCFDERLYNVDFCGALWLETDGLNCGNGGFSWRSKRLCDIVANDETIEILTPEDVSINRIYRRYLEGKYGLVWASDEIAEGFSFELREPMQKTFGFHGHFHRPYAETIIFKRPAALGDCLIMEPLLRHFAMQGYNIVVDIPIEYYQLYNQHYFPIKHISQFDSGRIPARIIDLTYAYEAKPRQNYLKSYFEFAGVKNFKLSRPQLYPLESGKTRYFEKYAIVHIDSRDTEYRNIFGVDWSKVQRHLEALGYIVLQIGKNEHDICGFQLNTASIGIMKHWISGASLFIGVDSGPSNIALAYNIPSVLLFGSVNPDYIHPDLTGTVVIQQKCIYQNCWHIPGSTNGKACVFNETKPPCCVSSYEEVIDGINKLQQK